MLDTRYDTFLTLCKEKSYTKAAEKLFISQPAVSQHIKWLETKYQTTFITYHNRELHLTKKGEEFYHYLTNLKAQTKRVETAIQKPITEMAQLNFAVTLSISEYLLPVILEDMVSGDTTKNISCLVENTSSILKHLNDGTIDFALVEGNFPKDECDYQEISSERFIPICSSQSYFAQKDHYQLKELFDETLIIRENGSGTRKIVDMILHEHNASLQDFKPLIEVGSFQSIVHLVKKNRGISFLYEAVVKNELASGELIEIPVRNLDTYHSFYFIYLKESIFEEEFMDTLNEIKKSIIKKVGQ